MSLVASLARNDIPMALGVDIFVTDILRNLGHHYVFSVTRWPRRKNLMDVGIHTRLLDNENDNDLEEQ